MKIPLIHMAKGPWGNDSDDQGPPNPWGKKPGPSSGAPNIDEALEKIKKRFSGSWGGPGEGGNGQPLTSKHLILGGAVVCALWLATGFYRVQEGEAAVVLRFGEMVRMSGAGLQYHIPSPIERVLIRKVAAVNEIEGGVRGEKGAESADPALILTKDENMVQTNYKVFWSIKDIKEFLFTARDPEATIRVAAESAIREVIGQTVGSSALTEGRDLVGSKATVLLQKLVDHYKMGVQISLVQLANVMPPREVTESFTDVQSSLVDASRDRNEAEAYRNDILPRARGRAMQIRQDAQAIAESRIAEAKGEASRFAAVLTAYQHNKPIVMKRMYFDVMEKLLARTNKLIMDPKAGGTGVIPYMSINELKAKAVAPKEEKK